MYIYGIFLLTDYNDNVSLRVEVSYFLIILIGVYTLINVGTFIIMAFYFVGRHVKRNCQSKKPNANSQKVRPEPLNLSEKPKPKTLSMKPEPLNLSEKPKPKTFSKKPEPLILSEKLEPLTIVE